MSGESARDVTVLGLVPARAGSKGVPNKNLRLLGGVPLVGRAIDTARAATHVTRVVLSTDSVEIAAAGRRHNADVPFLRPAEFARDDSPMVDVIRHALTWLEREERYCPSIVALLQPTVPFRTASQIDQAIDLLVTSDADSVVSVTAVPEAFRPAWQFRIKDGALESVEGAALSRLPVRRQDLDATYTRDGTIYVFWAERFMRMNSIYGAKTVPLILESRDTVNIDTMADWARAESLLAERTR